MDQPRIDTVRLQEMARAYCQSALLFSAIDIDLFTMVARGQDTEAKLASALDLSALDTERLVSACLAMGLLAWDGDRLVNAPDVQRFLVRGEPGYAGPWMTFTRPDVGKWFEMTTYLRAKRPPNLLGAMSDFTVEDARRYHEATNSIGMGAGRRFARKVDLSGRRLLLDLGGGSGAYSICAVQAFPGCGPSSSICHPSPRWPGSSWPSTVSRTGCQPWAATSRLTHCRTGLTWR